MSWLVESGCPLDPADLPAPALRRWAGVAGPVIDARHALLPDEAPGYTTWVEKRQQEFSSGRLYARRAMARLGLALQAIGREESRAPAWPGGVLGSLSHCDDVAAALIVPTDAARGVGLDIECRGRIHGDLYTSLFTAAEANAVRAGLSSTLLFATKEAIYKALHPLTGVFIDFPEMELQVQRGRLGARYLGSAAAVSALVPVLQLDARLLDRHVAAVAWLP